MAPRRYRPPRPHRSRCFGPAAKRHTTPIMSRGLNTRLADATASRRPSAEGTTDRGRGAPARRNAPCRSRMGCACSDGVRISRVNRVAAPQARMAREQPRPGRKGAVGQSRPLNPAAPLSGDPTAIGHIHRVALLGAWPLRSSQKGRINLRHRVARTLRDRFPLSRAPTFTDHQGWHETP